MRTLLYSLVIPLLLLPALGVGQGYVVQYFPDAGNPGGVSSASDSETSGWTTVFSGPATTNSYSDTVAIPFAFDFFGMPVDYLKAAPNGILTFDTMATALPNLDEPLPSTNLPDMAIAAWWDDFATPNSGDIIRWKVFGTAPNRQLWVKWHSMEVGTATFAYFMVVLEETSNNIYLVDGWSSGASGPARVGLQLDANTFVIADNSTSLSNNASSAVSNNDYYAFTGPVNGEDARATALNVSDDALNGCGSATEVVSLDILNGGNTTLAGLVATLEVDGTVQATESVPGSIASTASSTFIFAATADLSAGGPHTVRAWVTSGADIDPSNDTAAVSLTTVAPVAMPLAVDFTGYTGANLDNVFPGWDEGEGASVPDFAGSGWTDADFANDPGSPNGTAARLNLFSTFNDEWLISPKFTVDPGAQLRYDLAATTFSGTGPATFGVDDTFQVLISNDCGVSYTALQTFDANTPISNTGQLEAVDLSAFVGQEVIIAFFGKDGPINDPEDYNLYIDNINIIAPTPLDLAVSNLAVDPGCLGPAETVTVDLFNAGTVLADFSADPINWTLDIAGPLPQTITGTINTGTLAVGATLPVTVTTAADLSAVGTYDLTFAIDVTNDGVTTNDTAETSATNKPVFALPIGPVDFTGYTGSNLPTLTADQWFEAGGFPLPDSGFSGWINDDFGNDPNSPNGTAASFNYFLSGDEEWIVGPKFNVPVGAELTYDLALTPFSGTGTDDFGADDSLRVLISTDCGASYTTLQVYDANTPVSNTGQAETVDLSAFAGQDVNVAFLATEGATSTGDFNLYLDNILIQIPPNLDLEVTSLEVPTPGFCFGVEPINAVLTNVASDSLLFAQDTFLVTLDISGPIAQTILDTLDSGVLAPDSSISLTNQADFSAAGTYTVTLFISNPNDASAFNDTLTTTVAVASFTAPYLEDFDGLSEGTSFPAGWESLSTSDFIWEIESGTTPSSSTGPSGDNTTGTGNYIYTEASDGSQGDSAILITPCIDLSALSNPQLDFFYHMFGEDMGTFEVLIDDGSSITSVFTRVGEQDTAFSDTDPWNPASVSLSAYAGQTIRVIFLGERGSSFEGDMSVDDVFIYDPTGIDVSPIAATLPPSACVYDVDSTVTVDIVNNSVNALDLSTDPVTMAITTTGAVVQTAVVPVATGTIAVGDTFSVDVDLDFTVAGAYDVLVIASTATDENPFNDTLANLSRTTLPLYVAPYTEDFETGFVSSTGTNNPGELDFDWVRNRDEQVAWYPNDGSTPSTNTGPDGDNTTGSGVYMYTETSTPITGDTAILMSSCIDLSGLTTPVVEFFYHMYGDDMGTLFVEVENEQGDVATIWSLSGEQQTDNSDPFFRAIAPLNDFIGDTIMLRFVSIYGGGFNGDMAIDDITVKDADVVSLRANRVSAPILPGCVAESEPLELVIQNTGTLADFENDTLFLTATIDDGSAVQTILDTVTVGNLTTFDSLVHLFSSPAGFSVTGEYTLTLSFSFGPDQTPGDNSLSFEVVQVLPVALPSSVDFTGYTGANLDNAFPGWYEGDGEFVPDTTLSSSWTDEDFANDPNSLNGNAAKLDIFGSSKQEWIVSPPFEASDSTYLTYDIAITESSGTDSATLGSDDLVQVLVSTDCGGSYQPLLTYDASTPVSNTGESVAIDLSGFAGQKISVAFFGSEGDVNDPESVDVFLDNIFLGTPDTADIAAVSIIAPEDQACGDSMAMGAVALRNLGIFDADTVPVAITVVGPTGTTTFADTVFGPLSFGETDSLMFGPINTYAGGTYTIEAIAGLGGDQNLANDTAETTVFIRSTAPVAVIAPDSICPGEQATLVVDDTLYANSEFVWFEAGTQVATGDTFLTPPLTTATTYTVQRVDQGTAAGCATDPATVTIALLPDVIAGFTVDSTGDLFASFADASTNADSVRYLFGDGDSSSMLNPMYMYDTAGTYTVQQIAFGECGPDTATQQVTIVCEPAVGGFVVDSTGDLFIALTDTSVKADSVLYLFGDGNSSTTPSPTYMYDTAGTYTITQVAYHFCGNDTTELEVVIECNAAVPGFTFDQTDNLTITFTSTAQNADSIVLNLGDGNEITLTSVDTTYAYDTAGVYTVCMTVFNVCGEEETCEEVTVVNTSLGSVIGGSVSLFPNPTSGEVELRLSLLRPSNLAVEITDLRGRSLLRQDLGAHDGAVSQRFDLTQLPEGLYLFRILTEEQVVVRKLRVE